MVKWRLKSCPRCEGDIFLDRDLSGWFEHCIQCGYTGSHDITISWKRKSPVIKKTLEAATSDRR